MRRLAHQSWIAVLLLVGCDKPAIDSSQSLVGAKKLPSAKILSREVIQINRGFGALTSDWLSYELQPDNTLTITLTHRERVTPKDIIQGKETFELSPSAASQVRNDLWRLRSATLQGADWAVRPADCPEPPTDAFPEVAVAFIAEGPKPGIEDDLVGVSDIPTQDTCNTKQGNEARRLLEKVLRSFPASKVAAEFDRRAATT